MKTFLRRRLALIRATALILLILGLLSSFIPRQAPAATNPTLLYALDENQGATANDSSGNSNTGSLINGPTWVTGKYSRGINFDGTDDYINAGSGSSIDQMSQLTAEAWINPRTTGQFTSGDFFNKRGTNTGWRFDIASNNRELAFSVDFSSGSLMAMSTVGAVPLNTWTHVAAVWDGSPNGTNVKLYVNGNEVSHSLDFNGSGTRANDSGNNLIIGNNAAGNQTFDGIIDEVRIYNRALTQGEIQSDMATPITAPPGPGPDIVGQWSAPFSTPELLVHVSLLKTGEVLIWSAASGGVTQWLWNPSTSVFTPVSSGDNQFCSGQTILPDGRIMSLGGHSNYQIGIPDANLFDPTTRTWTAAPSMAVGRWYPTGTVLGDGRILVTSGNTTCGTCFADIPEVYDSVTNSWTRLIAAQYQQDLYPYMFTMPDGKVLYTGSDEAYTITRTLDVGTQAWTTLDNSQVPGGSAIMYRLGKVLKTGSIATGPQPSLSTSYVYDYSQPSLPWRQVGSMNEPRTYHTLTALPDGTVLVTGGVRTAEKTASQAALSAEVWNPSTESWTQLSSAQVKRSYHSTALLLIDGRVLVSGSGGDAAGLMTNELNAEIFSPPYLFKGPRPTISSVPSSMAYGSTYQLSTPNSAAIASVALVRAGAMTHTFNNDQRYVPLTFSPVSGGLNIQIPSNPNEAPPGYYMLFIVDSNGVPSVGSMVKISANAPPPPDNIPPSAPTNLTANVLANSVDLSWNAANDNVGVTGYDVHRSTVSGFTPSPLNQIAQVTTATHSDAGLSSGTYFYKVVARDAASNLSTPSNEATATVTPPPDVEPPTAPANLVANVNVNNVNLNWNAATDNVGVTGYDIHRSATSGFTPQPANRIALVTNTSFADNGLGVGTYYYLVVARDSVGNLSSPSNEASATVSSSPPMTVSFFSLASDGRVGYFGPNNSGCSQSTWDTAHAASMADADVKNPARTNFVTSGCQGFKSISLARGFLSFDTSSLPDTAVITSVRIRLYVTGKLNDSNDGNDFIVVVEGRQASATALVSSDFTTAGDAVTNPTEGSNRIDITSIGINAYTSWVLNSNGISWVSKTGYSKFALREGHDILNLWGLFGGGQGDSLNVALSEQNGTSQDPILEVTYFIP